MFQVNSSAIESISDIQDGKVTITFAGGRDYTYSVRDVEQFTAALTQVISEGNSVGRFVNQALRSEDLMTVWLVS